MLPAHDGYSGDDRHVDEGTSAGLSMTMVKMFEGEDRGSRDEEGWR